MIKIVGSSRPLRRQVCEAATGKSAAARKWRWRPLDTRYTCPYPLAVTTVIGPTTKTTIKIDLEVRQALIARMGAQESYNDVLRRILLQNGRGSAD